MSNKTYQVETILKPKNECIYQIPIKSDQSFTIDQYDSLSTTLAYLDKSYNSSIWKSTKKNINPNITKHLTTDFKTVAISLIETLYGTNSKLYKCSHLVELKNFDFDDEKLNFEYDLSNLFNLRDILLYSPRAIDNYEKILFILFQLFKFFKYLNSLNLNCNNLKLSDIYIDQNYWVRLKLPIEEILNGYKKDVDKSKEVIEKRPKESIVKSPIDTFYFTQYLSNKYDSFKHLNHNELANLTKSWCNNKISNFEYLLILNCIAGRKLNCPFNHPIFPWINDFQTSNSNLRDLTASKFRLNKGDAHLDLIYQASYNSPTGPYHLTEFLSEITYFVYKSRVTDKETLCKHVRRTWVPNEYPISMNRLYLWSPEECIPEFYCDPSIFVSIHDDLPDLSVPDWCNGSAEEFIRAHRSLLESDIVSKKLNHWIDLVFGFKLTGEAAVEAKNVCLPLIDNHQTMKPYGIVQLFTLPHPSRDIDERYHSEYPPTIKNKNRNKTDITEDLVIKSRLQSFSSADNDLSNKKKSAIKTDLNEINNLPIILPDDYNPLEELDQMETLLKFVNRAYHCLPDVTIKEKSNQPTFEDLMFKDLKCLACILCEIIMFNKLKCLPEQNTFENRYSFICKTIAQEPHIISGPFMPFILNVLKPFGDLSIEKQNLLTNKKSKNGLSFFLENILKYQSEYANIDTLLSPHLTILPFKPYFENLYKLNELTYKLDFLINEFENLKPSYIFQQLNLVISQTGALNLNVKPNVDYNQFTTKSHSQTLTGDDETSSKSSKENVNYYMNEDNRTIRTCTESVSDNSNNLVVSNINETEYQIKIETIYEQKFYLAFLSLPKLMYDMSDPKKNHLAQSICVANESFELIIQYLVNLIENPNTCVNAFLYLFSKFSKFLPKNELLKRFLPIILHVLNVVDLNETVGIDLAKDEEKLKFCKLFDYTFINELRIIFGLEIFLIQICPFLIEAISGFKDFEYELDTIITPNRQENSSSSNTTNIRANRSYSKLNLEEKSKNNQTEKMNKEDFNSQKNKTQKNRANLNRMGAFDQMSPVFDMENSNLISQNQIDLNKVDELDEQQEENLLSSKSLNNSDETVFDDGTDTNFQSSYVSFNVQQNKLNKNENFDYTDSSLTFDCDRSSLNSSSGLNSNSNTKHENISTTAFSTFTKIIPIIGPVLTCKYCCNDLFKMLAICYMNSKCLSTIETLENPLNSIRPIEGDRFACLILESLKTVACFYGEQVIVLQYLPNVSNTVAACVNRLSIRLEASLLAGIVLVNFFINYLDIKLLMDELNYIINQILIPVINLYTNEKIKFPNGFLMRQVLSYKTLDIILLLSLRIGPEQTRIEMERLLKIFFNGFSLVRSSIMNPSNLTKPLRIERLNSQEMPIQNQSKTNLSRGAFKARASIVSFNHQRMNNSMSSPKENLLLNNTNNSIGSNEKESEEMNSFDEYLKFSYDQTTNEIIGSSVKSNSIGVATNNKRLSLSATGGMHKYRTQSFGLLSLSNEENEATGSSENTTQNSPSSQIIANENKILNIEINEEMLNTFTIELAHTAYLSISRLNSGVYIDSILSNGDLIHRMCLLDEQVIRKQSQIAKYQNQQAQKKSKDELFSKSISGININNSKFDKFQTSGSSNSSIPSSSYGSSFSENVGIIGNQIQIKSDEPVQEKTDFTNITSELPFISSKFNLKFSEKDLKENKSSIDTSRHLSENWLAYWENEIRSNNKGNLFDFKHINLLTLSGHSSAVKCLHVLDNEASIISGSKDKTVKLWSLKIHGGNKKNQQTCQWTYSQHKKPIFSLLFIESLRVCATCDGSIWNPFVGRKLAQFDNQLITCMSNLPSPSTSFVIATADNSVKFIDLRIKSYAYELKTCFAPSGTIKSISTNENLLLVGFSTGLMCLLDMRTGWIQETCKTLDNEILQLKFFSNDKFIGSYNDGSIAISSIKDKVQVQNIIKVYNEPVPFLNINQNQLIAATNSNKIGIHSNIEKPSQMTSSINKLQPEIFKGVISSQTYLPLNRLLLIGSDNGDIKLIC